MDPLNPDPANPCCRALLEQKLSLEQFAELETMRDEATRYLAGKPLSAFRFVGIMERYAESLDVFGALLGVSVPAEPAFTLPWHRPPEGGRSRRPLAESYRTRAWRTFPERLAAAAS